MSLPEYYGQAQHRFSLSGMPRIELEVEAVIKRVYINSSATSQRYTEENGRHSHAIMDLISEMDPFPVETPISKECFEAALNGYEAMEAVAPCNVICKTRYFLPKWSSLKLEKYENSLEGLVILTFYAHSGGDYPISLLPQWAIDLSPEMVTHNPKYDERLMSYRGKPAPTLLDCIA